MSRLDRGGFRSSAASVLSQLVTLEASGHVAIDRRDGYRFALTDLGEETAYALGPGETVDVVLLMVDLVGFVSFTSEYGDAAAHHAAKQLHDLGDEELARAGGRVVKALGDGILGTARSVDGASLAAGRIAQRCRRPDGSTWSLRASCHRGRPINFGGDLFGADVNLASRLCEYAAPDELVFTVAAGAEAELLHVRGLTEPVAVQRVRLR
jgi:class 3 adenylate cyclase